jgi:hypothetical protein
VRRFLAVAKPGALRAFGLAAFGLAAFGLAAFGFILHYERNWL